MTEKRTQRTVCAMRGLHFNSILRRGPLFQRTWFFRILYEEKRKDFERILPYTGIIRRYI